MNPNNASGNNVDTFIDPHFHEYLSQYQLEVNNEPVVHYEEGELEAEWLISAGFADLTKPFENGQEIQNSTLEPILLTLPKPHAEAIKQRVHALNRTVRGRTKGRYSKRKPDIRDVFRDIDASSTGSRSRSATPDSLDSVQCDETAWTSDSISHNFDSIPDAIQPALKMREKQNLRRTPSAPLKGSNDLFRGNHIRCDIPFYTSDGIELLGFSRIGTIHLQRFRSGSDPSCSIGRAQGQAMKNAHSDNNISCDSSSDEFLNRSPPSSPERGKTKTVLTQIDMNSSSSNEGVSFESMMCRQREISLNSTDTVDSILHSLEYCSDIDLIVENELKRLQSQFWLELAAMFDKYHVALDKRKPFKRRRKEEGNLFGVSLNALIRRDQQITGEASSLVPLFLQGVLDELSKRGAREEGILRVAGHKQKTEILYQELEIAFYQNPSKVRKLLSQASVHDLSAILKRWLRELPQPLLTIELLQLFYQTQEIAPPDQQRALSIVCLMLPHENRNTLRYLLKFLNYVTDQQHCNKMSKHNVATIMAPSLFPPRYIQPVNKNSIEEQVKMAARCCHLTSCLITQGETLFMVPNSLISQAKESKVRQSKKNHSRAKKVGHF